MEKPHLQDRTMEKTEENVRLMKLEIYRKSSEKPKEKKGTEYIALEDRDYVMIQTINNLTRTLEGMSNGR